MFDSTPPMAIADASRGIDSVITEKWKKRRTGRLRKRLPTLESEAKAIVSLASSADDKTLIIALRAAALKQRIIAGHAGPRVKWMSWMRAKIKMSQSHLYALVKIGDAPNPEAALEDWRRDNRERSKNRGVKKPPPPKTNPPLSRNHRLMLKLVRKLGNREVTDEYVKLFIRYGDRLKK